VGDFIAKENIPVGEALAYSRGQRVAADAVKANGWDDLVVGEGTKEARQIQAEITGQPVEDFETRTTTSAGARAAAKTQEG
jgi:Tfp pilus assembly major pilin PilA